MLDVQVQLEEEIMNRNQFASSSKQGEMSLTFLEMLWALYALCCFWDRRFWAPYFGISVRKASILIHLRRDFLQTSQDIFPEIVGDSDEFEGEPESKHDCDHPECEEIHRRLVTIRREQGPVVHYEALTVLVYCRPCYWDEVECDDMPTDADKWIDRRAMPHTARRWEMQQRAARERERRAFGEVQRAEVRREMLEDRELDEHMLASWQRLMKLAKERPLTEHEKWELKLCERIFGGRDQLIEHHPELAAFL